MITILHKEEDRGKRDHGWLKTAHSFSFGDWFNPERTGYGALLVINDDTIAPRSGFGRHSHEDMEIITIVMNGAVEHKDTMGNSGFVQAGDVQLMSAGTGVLHSEHNAHEKEELELFQIWIQPKETGTEPRYEQRPFRFLSMEEGTLTLVDPYGKEGLRINQDAYITFTSLKENALTYEMKDKNHGLYVFVIEGSVEVADRILSRRDALGLDGILKAEIIPKAPSKLLLIEVPME